jgi:hypothetical protein
MVDVHIFIICIYRWRLGANSVMLWLTGVVVVVIGDICKLTSKAVHFCLGGVFVQLGTAKRSPKRDHMTSVEQHIGNQ